MHMHLDIHRRLTVMATYNTPKTSISCKKQETARNAAKTKIGQAYVPFTCTYPQSLERMPTTRTKTTSGSRKAGLEMAFKRQQTYATSVPKLLLPCS